MKKKINLFALSTFLSMASLAQTVQQNIDKAAKDPSTKENAAKADVRLHDKKTIADSASLATSQEASAISKRKKTKSCSKSKRSK
jgi:hypothetical protein